MYLTNHARIGKRILRAITGVQRPHKRQRNLDNGETEEVYYNEANRFHITTTERLSKLQIKQFLLFHFIDIDRFGIVKNISLEKIANILGCSINTVKNNNKRLEELEYITFTNYYFGRFSAFIRDYPRYHLTKRDGGSGYLTMNKNIIMALIGIDDVNVLRLELRQLIKLDESNMNNSEDELLNGEYSYNDIRLFLPQYKSYKKAIKELSNYASSLFQTKVLNNKLTFNLVEKYRESTITKEIISMIDDIHEKYTPIIDIDYPAILDKTIKYGKERVSLALDHIYKKYIMKERKIKNIEGLLVAVIRGQNSLA